MAHAQVARVEPAALEGLGGGFRIVVVAQHDDIAAHDHFAHGGAICGDIPHLVIHDPNLAGTDVSHALAGAEIRLIRGGHGRQTRRRHVDGEGSVDLGQTVDMLQLEVQLGHARDERRGGRRARCEEPHGLDQRVGGRIVHEHGADRGSRAEVGHTRVEQLPGGTGLDLGDADALRAHGHDTPGEAPAVAVEHGQRPQVAGLDLEAVVDDHGQGIQVGTPVVVDHALGPAGGTRCVVDGDGLVLALQHQRHGLLGALGQQGLEVRSQHHPLDGRGHQGQRGQQLRGHEDLRGAAVLDDVGHLVLVQAGVDGHQHAPGEGDGGVGDEERLRVEGEEGDAVALLQVIRPQGRGQAPGPGAGLAPSKAAVPIRHRGPVRKDLARPLHEVDGGELLAKDLGGGRGGRGWGLG